MIKNILNLIGAALALSGSVLLFRYGHCIAGVFEILTMNAPNQLLSRPHPFHDFPFVSCGTALLMIGFSLTTLVSSKQKGVESWLTLSATAVAIIGCVPVCFSVIQNMQSFRVIATSPVGLKPEEVHDLIQSSSVLLMVGFVCLALATTLLLSSSLLSLRSQLVTQTWLVVMPVGFFALTGLVSTYSFLHHGTELYRFNGGKPNQLATHLIGCQNAVLVAFLSIALIGAVKLVSATYQQTVAPAAGSVGAHEIN